MMISKRIAGRALIDSMGGCDRWETKIGEHGFVALVDVMPRLGPADSNLKPMDAAIVQAARVSYGEGTKKISEDKGLIRYLMRHRHTTPFEMCELKFHCAMPLFVARQWIRHRTANVNEYSARYSIVQDKFFVPDRKDLQQQDPNNKQGRLEPIDDLNAERFYEYLNKAEALYDDYHYLVANGMSREIARIGLPVSVFTEWYWKIDLHNLFHFLSLRMDSHAQKEIRDYAVAMFAMVQELAPVASEAFVDYRLESLTLSAPEIRAFAKGYHDFKGREAEEYETKLKRLGQ